MSAPESVRTKDGMVWTLRTVTSSGIALYAPKGVCECPAFVMATLAELAEHGIQSAELAAAVAEHGAFPVPVGPVPQELPAERLTEIAARTQAATAGPWWTDTLAESDGSESIGVDAGDDNWIVPCQDLDPADAEFIAHARADVPALLTEIGRLTAQRDRRRTRLVALQNDALNMRGALSLNGEDRKVPFPLGPTLLPAVEWLIGRVAELERLLAEDGCSCPPADPPHQVGCPLDLPAPGSSERPVNELTSVFMPVASLREDVSPQVEKLRNLPAGQRASLEDPHDSPLAHPYRLSHDLPELGGA